MDWIKTEPKTSELSQMHTFLLSLILLTAIILVVCSLGEAKLACIPQGIEITTPALGSLKAPQMQSFTPCQPSFILQSLEMVGWSFNILLVFFSIFLFYYRIGHNFVQPAAKGGSPVRFMCFDCDLKDCFD